MAAPAVGRMIGRRIALAALLAAVLLLFIMAPSLVPTYYLTVFTRIAIMAMFAVAFNVVFGMGGMPSLGHAAFFGAGAYTLALGVIRWDWGFGTVVVMTLLVGGGLGLVYGLLCQRVEGIYLLLMTLALAQAIWGLAFQNVRLTGGDMGLSGPLRQVVPIDLTTREDFHVFAVLVSASVIAVLWFFMISPVGKAIVGLRESETRLQTLGYNVAIYKVVAFVVSGAACAVAGALQGMQQGFVGVDNLEWTLSATVLLAAIVGGSRYFLGPAIGIAAVIGLETYVMEYTDRYMTVMGVAYIIAIFVLPKGVLGLRGRWPGRGLGSTPQGDGDDELRAAERVTA